VVKNALRDARRKSSFFGGDFCFQHEQLESQKLKTQKIAVKCHQTDVMEHRKSSQISIRPPTAGRAATVTKFLPFFFKLLRLWRPADISSRDHFAVCRPSTDLRQDICPHNGFVRKVSQQCHLGNTTKRKTPIVMLGIPRFGKIVVGVTADLECQPDIGIEQIRNHCVAPWLG